LADFGKIFDMTDQQLPGCRATARTSVRTATGAGFAAGADLANSVGARPTAAIMPPNLAKNDLREQAEFSVGVRFKSPLGKEAVPPM
jgi:hypothetical protein